MKAHFDKDFMLVITPENYPEQFALRAWVEQYKPGQDRGTLILPYEPEVQSSINGIPYTIVKTQPPVASEAKGG